MMNLVAVGFAWYFLNLVAVGSGSVPGSRYPCLDLELALDLEQGPGSVPGSGYLGLDLELDLLQEQQ